MIYWARSMLDIYIESLSAERIFRGCMLILNPCFLREQCYPETKTKIFGPQAVSCVYISVFFQHFMETVLYKCH